MNIRNFVRNFISEKLCFNFDQNYFAAGTVAGRAMLK